MCDQIINAMSKDLGVQKYEGESEVYYVCRTLYAGLACWIKAITFDTALSELSHPYTGTSKKHIHDKCEKVLSEFLDRFPFASTWFYGIDKGIDPVSVIRHRLYSSGDVINMGFQTNVGLVKTSELQLTNELLQIKGVILQPDCFYSGVSTVKRTTVYRGELPEMQRLTSQEWLIEFVNQSWWKKGELIDEHMEYFNAQQHSPNNSIWSENKSDYISGIVLSRRQINKSAYEYILQKRVSGEVYHHRVDPFLQETREYRRIMFALRALVNNPPPAKAKGSKHHIHLSLRVHLPNKEQQCLESFAWPCKTIDDKLEWDMPYEMWIYIKGELLRLGLNVTEDIHG